MDRGVTQALKQRNHSQTILDNGLKILTVENPAADIISARIFLRAGSRYDPPGKAGLAHLLSAVLTKGTRHWSSFEIAEQIESVGASLGADAAADYFLLSLKTVSADFAEIFAIAAEMLRFPTFPEAEVQLERRLTLQAIRSQQEQPFTVALERLRQAMYCDHPYALSGLGNEETVPEISRDDLLQFHRTYFRPDNLTISLAGSIADEVAVRLIKTSLGDWQPPAAPLPEVATANLSPKPQSVLTPQETQQSILMLGYLTPAVCYQSPTSNAIATDYAALKLLSTYLGNGLSSRLFVELREKRGLAYEVSAFYPTRLDWSHFVVYMGTAPDNTAIALEGLQAEIDRLCKAPLSHEELQTAKNKLLGQYALGKQTNSQIAQVMGWYEILGLTAQFDWQFQQEITAVSPELAQETACRYLQTLYLSIVGPEAVLQQLSPVSN